MSFSPLTKDFISLLKSMDGASAATLTLFEWLKLHPSYHQGMWLEKNEEGETPLMNLLRKRPERVFRIYASIIDEINPSSVDEVFNTVASDGETALSLIWEGVEARSRLFSNSYSKVSFDHWDIIDDVRQKTSPEHWSFLDKEGSRPCSGWEARLFALASDSEHQKNILKALNEYSAPPRKPAAWFSATNEDKINILVERGESVTDLIPVGKDVSLPVWQIVCANPTGQNRSLNKAIRDGHFKDLPEEEVKDFLSGNESMTGLIPHDRRAKMGYVKMVLNNRSYNSMGQNSLYYLMEHRSDLMEMLCSKMPEISEEARTHFSKPDRAGFNVGFHALVKLSNDKLKSFKQACKTSGIAIDTDFGPQGFLINGMPWALALKGENKNTGYVFSSICSKIRESLSGEEIFGDRTQQLKWVEWWEKRWPMLIENYRKTPNTAVKEMMVHAAILPFKGSSLTLEGVIPELEDCLRFMHTCIQKSVADYVTSSSQDSPWFKAGLVPKGSEDYSAVMEVRKFIPEHLTEGMCKVLESEVFIKDPPRNDSEEEMNRVYKSTASRFRLQKMAQKSEQEKMSSQSCAPVKVKKL